MGAGRVLVPASMRSLIVALFTSGSGCSETEGHMYNHIHVWDTSHNQAAARLKH